MSDKTKTFSSLKSSNKTLAKNRETSVHRGVFSPSELIVVEYLNVKKVATLKELATVLFEGDYLKAKNVVRRTRWSGLIKFGKKRGSYAKVGK